MAHELFGERFYGRRELAWHKLGKVFHHNPTAQEAFTEAGLMYRVHKAPIFAYIQGDYRQVEDESALVRDPVEDDPQHRIFGVVSKYYQVVNNEDIAPIVDVLVGAWPLETVGALRGGRTIFVTLKAGRDEVGGDELEKYFLLTDTKDGRGGAMRLAFTPIRVVCQNTLTSALSRTGNQFALSHTGNLQQDLATAVELLAASRLESAAVMNTFRRMAAIRVEEESIQHVIEHVYPFPNIGQWEQHVEVARSAGVSSPTMARILAQHEEREVVQEAMLRLRVGAWELYRRFCDEHSDTAQTTWAVYNAVVELEDWRSGNREEESLLFGQRADRKARAFSAAVKALS